MENRLAKLHLIPPAADNPWAGCPITDPVSTIRRGDGVSVTVDTPLFWYDPPWIRLPVELADALAVAVAEHGLVVSALKRDLTDDEELPEFFRAAEVDSDVPAAASSSTNAPEPRFLPRMTPYRVERYGLSADDFDQTRLIDVRLSPSRDTSGRLAYSPLQMERWERPSKDSVIAGGGYVVAGAFPFDVASAKQFPNKVEQLRRLAPAAAVMLSIRPFRLAEELAIAAGASPDGVILRMDDPEFEPLELAGLVRRARDLLSNKHGCDLPLWVVPGEISPRDAAKLIALGADAVAIDAWCEPVVDEAVEALQATSYQSTVRREIAAIVTDLLWPKLDLALGIMSSIPAGRRTLDGKASRDGWASRDALGSFHPRWAETCGVPLLK